MAANDPIKVFYDRSNVRRKDRLILNPDEGSTLHWWLPESIEVAKHPLIEKKGLAAKHQLELGQLYRFHYFTERLEYDAVNPVAQNIAMACYGDLVLPPHYRQTASGIYVEEGFHALMSADLMQQVSQATGCAPCFDSAPIFLDRLASIQDQVPVQLRELVKILFVVVSETLITHTFSDLPKDQRVVSLVRENIRHHYEDEGRHAAFFTKFFETVWPQLTAEIKKTLGPLLPNLILSFCEADYRSMGQDLGVIGFSKAECHEIITDCFPSHDVARNAKKASAATIKLFERSGVLENARTEAAFFEAGLIDGS
jgi:hypothetical protein